MSCTHIAFNFDNLAYDQSRLYTVMLFHILCWRKLLWGHKWQMLKIMMNRCFSQKRYYKKLFWNERIITITNFFFVHVLCVMFPFAYGYCTFQLFYKMILLEKMSEQKVWHSLNWNSTIQPISSSKLLDKHDFNTNLYIFHNHIFCLRD